jgi:hypothetical protein
MAKVRRLRLPKAPRWQGDARVGRVVFGTPCYGGQVTIGWAESYAETRLLLSSQGVQTAFVGTRSESLVQRARDLIAANFLAIEHATHLMFIDADIEWDAHDVLRLLSHDVEAIAGIYPKKTYPIEYPFHPLLDENGHANRDPRTGRVEIGNAPTGFLCLKREAFLRYIDAYPQSKIQAMQNVPEHVLPWLYDFFPAQLEEGILWSEDYGFCRRYRAAGGQVWMDPYIKLSHTGAHTFQGDPAKIIRMPPESAPMSAAA